MRTKGSFSFASITLADLNARFKPDAQILVSVRFLRANGMTGDAKSCKSDYQTIQATGEPVSIQEIKFE